MPEGWVKIPTLADGVVDVNRVGFTVYATKSKDQLIGYDYPKLAPAPGRSTTNLAST